LVSKGLGFKRRLLQLRSWLVLPTVLVTLTLGGCAAGSGSEPPTRSPSRDYPAPPAQTSDGSVVGADGKSPKDTLETGPTNERPAPGWTVEEGRPEYDPKNRVGGETDHDPEHPEDDESDGAR
jgi:hypothetical protein